MRTFDRFFDLFLVALSTLSIGVVCSAWTLLIFMEIGDDKENTCTDSSKNTSCVSSYRSSNPNPPIDKPIHMVAGDKFQQENDLTLE